MEEITTRLPRGRAQLVRVLSTASDVIHVDDVVIALQLDRTGAAQRLSRSYDQKQRVEKKRRLYIVPRAFLWKTPRLPCRFHVSILHTGSPSPAVMA